MAKLIKTKIAFVADVLLAGAWQFQDSGVSSLLSDGIAAVKQSSGASSESDTQSRTASTDAHSYDYLADKEFKSGDKPAIQVNNGKSTLAASKWKHSKIEYGDLDNRNRTTTDTAYLDRHNLGKSAGRTPQTWNPTGWHNQPIRVSGSRVYPQNRGHPLAYTVTFNFDDNGNYKSGENGSLDNPKNLTTQTAFSNQKTMQIYEGRVRDAMAHGKKVIY